MRDVPLQAVSVVAGSVDFQLNCVLRALLKVHIDSVDERWWCCALAMLLDT